MAADQGVEAFAGSLRRVIQLAQHGKSAGVHRALATSVSTTSQLSHLEPQAKAMVAAVLGQVSCALGEYDTAESQYKFYCETIKSIYGKDHLATSDAYSTYAVFLARRLQLRRALDYAGQALVIRLERLGVFHVCTADSHFNLGLLFRMLRRYPDSIREFEFARSIRHELLGSDSLASGEVDFSLACTHQMCGRYDEAFVNYSNAQRCRRMHLGAAHPHTRCAGELAEAMRNALVGKAYNIEESESALVRMSKSHDPTIRAIGDIAGRSVRKILGQRGWFVLLPGEEVRGLDDAGQRATLGRFLEGERRTARIARSRFDSTTEPDSGSSDESVLSEPAAESSPEDDMFGLSVANGGDRHYEFQDLRAVLSADADVTRDISEHARRSLLVLLRRRRMPRSAIFEALPRERPDVDMLLDAVDRYRRRSAQRPRRGQAGSPGGDNSDSRTDNVAPPSHAQSLVAVPKGYYPVLMPEGYFFSHANSSPSLPPGTFSGGVGDFSPDVDDDESSIGGDSIDTARSDDTRRMARRAPQGKSPLLATSRAVDKPSVVHAEEGAQTEEQYLEPEDESHGRTVAAPLQEGLAYTISNQTNRRLKPVVFAPEELWALGHLKMLAFGLFPFMLQHKKFLAEAKKKAEEDRAAALATAAKKNGERAAKAKEAADKRAAAAKAKKDAAAAKKAAVAKGKEEKAESSGPKMKQFHWDVMKDIAGTVWDTGGNDTQKAEDDELMKLFPDLQDAMNAAQPKVAAKESKKDEKAKPKQVSMIDGKRSQNMCIMLAQFGRIPFGDIIEAICQLDVEVLDLEGIKAIGEYTPEDGEKAAINDYIAKGGNVDLLGKAEKYILAMSDITLLKQRLQLMELQCSFDPDANSLEEDLDLMLCACGEVNDSTNFPKLLKLVLKIGNALNQGSSKGGATGFRIGGLMKLAQTKTNQGTTLLEYIILGLEKSDPDMVVGLTNEFPSAPEALRKSLQIMTAEFKKLEKGLAQINTILSNPKASADPNFEKMLPFKATALGRIQALEEKLKAVEKDFEGIVLYLGENPKRMSTEDFFKLLDQFQTTFCQSVENLKQQREKRERAQKREAEKLIKEAKRRAAGRR